MKNLYKKILPFFGASCCFLPTKHFEVINLHEKSELINLTAKLSTITQNKKSLSSINNNQLQEFIDELNLNEIYILVTDSSQEKCNKNILLLLHPEDRLNAEQSLINSRHVDILYERFKSTFFEKTKFTKLSDRLKEPSDLLKAKVFPSLTKLFRGGKSYYVNNLGGYKSICPIFFDKALAEEFLIKTSIAGVDLLKTMPLDSNKKILKGILNTKIISLGFGDFINYYSQENNKKYLEKVEFFFVPCLKKENTTSKIVEKKMNTIDFKTYQKQYFELLK